MSPRERRLRPMRATIMLARRSPRSCAEGTYTRFHADAIPYPEPIDSSNSRCNSARR